MTTTILFALKGGQGTTTLTAALAAIDGDCGVGSHDPAEMAAMFGIAAPQPGFYAQQIQGNLVLHEIQPGSDYFDAGTLDEAPHASPGDRRVLVVRNDYLALRRCTRLIPGTDFDDVICVVEPNRALGARDVQSVLGCPVTAVPLDPAVARCVDAGLLLTRVPRPLADAAKALASRLEA